MDPHTWVAFILVALLAGGAPAAAESAAEAYRRGIEAVDRGDWSTVRAAMQTALESRPEPGGRPVKIYGMRFEDYVPQFFLGLAHEALGDCASALVAWSTPALPSRLDRSRRARLEAGRERCRPSPPTEQDSAGAPPPSELAQPPEPARFSDPGQPVSAGPEAVEAPSPVLRRAAADYLAGRYADVVAHLDPGLEAPGSQGAATAWLLRGAARHALHRQTGEPTLLDGALRDLRAHHRLRPAARPSPFWFSPALRDFYDRATAQKR